ncbi:ABC transporter transmembrane region family protein, partial [Vibrio parahaemolyticus VP2007-007]
KVLAQSRTNERLSLSRWKKRMKWADRE